MLALTCLMGLGWALGVTSAHFQREELMIAFLIVHFILALSILILRVFFDKQVSLGGPHIYLYSTVSYLPIYSSPIPWMQNA